MSEKILVLVEGIAKEMDFFNTFNCKYIGLDNDIQLIPFGCNIYSLFQEMKDYDFDIELEKAIELSPFYPFRTEKKNKRDEILDKVFGI